MKNKNEVMIDNWTLFDFIEELTNNENPHFISGKVAFLQSVLLWDTIYLNKDSTCLSKFDMNKNIDAVNGLRDVFVFFESPHYSETEGGLLERTDMYLHIAKTSEINYFPHPERFIYIDKQMKSGLDIFDRRIPLETVDKHLNEYYKEIEALIGNRGYFEFSSPVLYDYISENAASTAEQLEIALQLREESNFIEFRKNLGLMDELLNEGRTCDFGRIIKTIEELCKEIIHTNTSISETKIKVKWTFPLKFDVSKELEITIPSYFNDKLERNINLTFLVDLLDFGLNRRRQRFTRKYLS